ncbi:peptidoglycan-binding domain-containing protein [Marinobacter sp.]|uniref:peptidoglycan-binding domain-containing protein n=1 Tax=Marinobacter sp. TaxID=50741 RepID=UPI00356AE7D3
MTRSQQTSNSGFRGRAIVLLAAATCLGTAHAAEPEKTIFAAENALYGAGHDIGRADGWFDDELRAAIRTYQNANGLQANGNLDTETLKALGVNSESATTITANSVSSPEKSAAVLGLSYPDPTPASPAVAEAEAEPEPRPEVAPEPVQQPPEPIETTAVSKVEKQESQTVTQETSKPSEDIAIKETVTVAETKEPEISEPATPTPESDTKVVDKAPQEEPAKPDPVLAQLPTEPTGAGNQEAEQPVEPEPEASKPEQLEAPVPENQTAAKRPQSTGGGFFSTLFDFFFGWLV